MNTVTRVWCRIRHSSITAGIASLRTINTSQGLGDAAEGNGNGKNRALLEGIGLVQEGNTMQELPLIVRVVAEIQADTETEETKSAPKEFPPDSAIHKLIGKEFRRCQSKKDVFSLLQRCSMISPNIAAGAINRLNQLRSVDQVDPEPESLEMKLREKLLDVVIEGDVSALLAALADYSDGCLPCDRLCDEILLRVSEGKLTVAQLCDVVELFGENMDVPKFAESVDKLWVGFTYSESAFSDADLMRCMDILQYLRASRRVVLSVIEKNAHRLWWKFRSSQVVDIVRTMEKNGIPSARILSVVGRWTNLNIHSVSESALTDIVSGLTKLSYTDDQLEKALERYVKHKGVNVNSTDLILSIIEHCFVFRIRNVHILGGCCEHFIAHGKTAGRMLLKPLMSTIGWLHYLPAAGSKFWQEVESVFNDRFHAMGPCDVLDVMLSCIYLEKHPMNFVSRIFNPSFLERINSSPNADDLRRKLKLIDIALTLECRSFAGPLLPKDHRFQPLWQDGRIRRVINNIKDSLEKVAGHPESLSTHVMFPNFGTSILYMVDVMMHPKGLSSSILNVRLKSDRNVNVAVLIQLPEHYSSTGEFLIGPQLMRIRHFRHLGLKVANLNYDLISRLKVHRSELEQYIKSQLKKAEPAYDVD